MVAEAEAHEKKYGFYPVFEMEEIEYDDPVLDNYKDDRLIKASTNLYGKIFHSSYKKNKG